MGILDVFKAGDYKSENEKLKSQLDDLQKTFTPEMQNAANLKDLIRQLNESKLNLENEINTLKVSKNSLNDSITEKKKQLVIMDEEILMQEFALYEPKYNFTNSEQYKNRLDQIRTKQKELIKLGSAATGNMNWTVNNSLSKGKKMVKDMQKLLIRAFNSECEEIIDRVKYNNFEQSLKRISNSFDAISKLGTIMTVAITQSYYHLKIEELTLSFEYQQKKQEEKEEQKAIREQMREEAKLQREIEEARKDAEKEKKHYSNALEKIQIQLKKCNDNFEKNILLEKIRELESRLDEINKNLKAIDYREANQRAGYVYIISNIGAFGENIYKIGMTRRLEPIDRIDELSSASVPFKFDVHAMIFSDDAPKLENALHNAFADKKLNMVNTRKEFFNVTLEEIEDIVKKNHDKSVEFIKYPDAQQYRETLKLTKTDSILHNRSELQPIVRKNITPKTTLPSSSPSSHKTATYKIDLIRHTPHKKRVLPNKHLRKK